MRNSLLDAEVANTDGLDLSSFVQFLHVGPRFIEGRRVGDDILARIGLSVWTWVPRVRLVVDVRKGLGPMHKVLHQRSSENYSLAACG